jgi:hypothetical protein
MATAADVLNMLCQGVEYALIGDEYESINWFDKEPAITKEEYLKGFETFDSWKSKEKAEVEKQKSALLTKLGITADEAELLLS